MNIIKVCVFCNKYPVSKSKEHVIPEWLIKMTGDQYRLIKIAGVGTDSKLISFNTLTFPACKKCNNIYSNLEHKAKAIIEKIVRRQPISAIEIEIIMDWLDKVRIGMWLGSLMYSKNPFSIFPHFGIVSRPKKDRLLIISTTSESSIRLNFSGFNDPLFHFLPCFFGIIINNVSIMSMSADFLLNNELPLPNWNKVAETRGGKLLAQLEAPKKLFISLPYVGKRFTTIAQINYQTRLDRKYFSKEQIIYIKEDVSSSKILLIKRKKMFIYPDKYSDLWKPEDSSSIGVLIREQNQKYTRLRSWIAVKCLKDSQNPFYKNLYSKLVNTKFIKQNY